MDKNIYGVSFLRNYNICANHNEALTILRENSSKINDGEFVLVRYFSDENEVKTLIGCKYDSNSTESFTFIDIEEIEKAISVVTDDIDYHVGNNVIHVTSDDKLKWNGKAEISDIPDVSNFIDGAEYETDGVNHSIVFYHGNTYIDSIDANPFLIDGMVDDVRVEDGNLIIDFNTESGKQDISIPLTEIFNPEIYYTKEDVDTLLSVKENEIYDLKKIVGELGGNVTYDLPKEGKSFNALMNNNGTVKLSEDVETGRFGPGIMASNKVKLNLNGHNLTISGLTQSSSTSAIQARGSEEITIGGKGIIDAGEGIVIQANGANAIINLTGSTTTYQTNRQGGELIYCYVGTINITNGTFKNNGSKYLLNCYDANYKNGTANIIVSGGKFYDFDPGNNTAEGEGTSFLAEGYHTESSTVIEDEVEHTIYTVKKD